MIFIVAAVAVAFIASSDTVTGSIHPMMHPPVKAKAPTSGPGFQGMPPLLPPVESSVPKDDPTANAVKNLTSKTFDLAIKDPSNNELWLLLFHNPGCPHCKRLVPILEEVAPRVADKMSFGKVDCFAESELCKFYELIDVPTLMYARNGRVVGDYYGRRDSESIIGFANKMSGDAVAEISGSTDIEDLTAANEYGVAFVAYDPFASGSSIKEVIKSSKILSAFDQVAKKHQAHSSFGVIMPDAIKDEVIKFPSGKEGPIMAKLEEKVAPKLYQGKPSVAKLSKFVGENKFPIVTPLGPHNYHDVGQRGDRIALLFVDPEQHSSAVAELRQYAVFGPSNVTDQFIFSWIDAKAPDVSSFLNHFSISQRTLPELVVYDASTGQRWQNSPASSQDFLELVASGSIRPLGGDDDVPKRSNTLATAFVILFAFAVWLVPIPARYMKAIVNLTKDGEEIMEALVCKPLEGKKDSKAKKND